MTLYYITFRGSGLSAIVSQATAGMHCMGCCLDMHSMGMYCMGLHGEDVPGEGVHKTLHCLSHKKLSIDAFRKTYANCLRNVTESFYGD